MATGHPTILQIIPRLDTGGAELSTLEITDAVVRAGGRMIVVTAGGRLAPRIAELGGELVPMPAATKNPARMLANARALAALIERENVTLVHARSRAPAWSGLLAARRTKRPFVTTYHGAYASKGRVKDFYNSVMARGDLVIANSHFTERLIIAQHHTPAERIRVIHRGVDLAAFDPERIGEQRLGRLRAQWKIAPGTTVILQAARLTGWKGQTHVIEAARRLHADNALGDAVVILAGDAQGRESYAAELEAQIAAGGLRDRVRLVGHCDDIVAAFRLAHVAVVASVEPEAFGRAAAEAMAMGCPVIATDIGAPAETVLSPKGRSNGARTGWLVPPADPAAIAAALREALSLDPAQRAQIASVARAHVGDHYSLDHMKRQTLAVYDALLGSDLVTGFADAHGETGGSS